MWGLPIKVKHVKKPPRHMLETWDKITMTLPDMTSVPAYINPHNEQTIYFRYNGGWYRIKVADLIRVFPMWEGWDIDFTQIAGNRETSVKLLSSSRLSPVQAHRVVTYLEMNFGFPDDEFWFSLGLDFSPIEKVCSSECSPRFIYIGKSLPQGNVLFDMKLPSEVISHCADVPVNIFRRCSYPLSVHTGVVVRSLLICNWKLETVFIEPYE